MARVRHVRSSAFNACRSRESVPARADREGQPPPSMKLHRPGELSARCRFLVSEHSDSLSVNGAGL